MIEIFAECSIDYFPLSGQQVRLFVNKTRNETIFNPFNIQSEFTALQKEF